MTSYYANFNNQIFKSSGKILGVCVTAIGGDSGITLYDGENTSGDVIGKVYAKSGESVYVSGKCFRNCDNGCFVAVVDANAYYTIGYDN